jgi:hypothetical protein
MHPVNRAVNETAKLWAGRIAQDLREHGWHTSDPEPSGNIPGAWTIDAESSSHFTLNIEVAGGPWEGHEWED